MTSTQYDDLNNELIEIKKKSDDLLDQKCRIERQERELKNLVKDIKFLLESYHAV